MRSLSELQRRLDLEEVAHARTRAELDRIAAARSNAEGDLNTAREEVARGVDASARLERDLNALRDSLDREQAAHRQTRERLVRVEAEGADQTAALAAEANARRGADTQAKALATELAELRERLGQAQSAALAAEDARREAQGRAATLDDRVAGLRRQLEAETEAHTTTRRTLEERVAVARDEAARQRRKRIGATAAAVAGFVGVLLSRRRG
ncbi:MAG: hypothetical protein R3B09_02060 [Nannocystaceae bacterium]